LRSIILRVKKDSATSVLEKTPLASPENEACSGLPSGVGRQQTLAGPHGSTSSSCRKGLVGVDAATLATSSWRPYGITLGGKGAIATSPKPNREGDYIYKRPSGRAGAGPRWKIVLRQRRVSKPKIYISARNFHARKSRGSGGKSRRPILLGAPAATRLECASRTFFPHKTLPTKKNLATSSGRRRGLPNRRRRSGPCPYADACSIFFTGGRNNCYKKTNIALCSRQARRKEVPNREGVCGARL